MSGILDEVRKNLQAAYGCKRHQFVKQDGYVIGQKLECTHCGTSMYLSDIGLYIQGFVAAGGNANMILDGWKPPYLARKQTKEGKADGR